MRYYKYVLLLICFSTKSFSQSVDSVYTLQQCIDMAIKNNLDVRKSELQMETDRIYWKQARENMLPTLNGSVNHTIYNGRSQNADLTYVNNQITNASYDLSSNLTLFNGFNLMNSIKQSALAYQAGKMDYQQAKNDISLNVITTYLQVLDNEDQLALAKTQIEVSTKQVERLEILNKDGGISPSQLYDLRGQLANDKLTVLNAQSAIYSAKLNLLQLMNVPFSKDIRLARLSADQLPGIYGLSQGQVYNTALNDLALVKAAELRVKGAEKGVKAASGNLFPTLYFNGGISTLYSSGSAGTYSNQFKNNYNTGLGIGLSIPILNNLQRHNNVSLAKIDLLSARYTNETTKIQLKQNVEQAYVNMTTAYERYQIFKDQVAAYAESFRTAEVKFNDGALNSVDYLVAKGNMDRAKTGLINARYDYFIRTKILDYYQGKLTL